MLISRRRIARAAALAVWFLIAGAGGFALPGPDAAQVAGTPDKTADTPPPPERRREIEKLVKDLGDDEFAKREAAQKALEQLGEEALPALEKALATDDAEIRRRVEALVTPLRRRVRERQAEKLLAQTAKGGIDVLVEYLVRKGNDVGDGDWDLLQQLVTRLGEKSGKAKKFDVKKWPVRAAGGDVVDGKAVADEVKGNGVVDGALVVRGPVAGPVKFVHAVILANGDIDVAGIVDCYVISAGDVRVKGQVVDSVVVAAGSVKAASAVDTVLAACGPVTVDGTKVTTKLRPEEKTPLGAVTFFTTALLGAEAAPADGKVRVEKVEAGTPLAKAGLQKGDVVTSVGARKVETVEEFRRALRRGLAEGIVVLKVQRGGRSVEVTAKLLD